MVEIQVRRTSLVKIYREAQLAYLDEQTADSNPWPRHSDEALTWLRGYRTAGFGAVMAVKMGINPIPGAESLGPPPIPPPKGTPSQ